MFWWNMYFQIIQAAATPVKIRIHLPYISTAVAPTFFMHGLNLRNDL